MNRRLSGALRRIEKSIEALDTPQFCGANFHGDLRTLSPVAKTRELENLVQKLGECQLWVKSDSEQEWLNGVKETLKSRLELVFNPPLIN